MILVFQEIFSSSIHPFRFVILQVINHSEYNYHEEVHMQAQLVKYYIYLGIYTGKRERVSYLKIFIIELLPYT